MRARTVIPGNKSNGAYRDSMVLSRSKIHFGVIVCLTLALWMCAAAAQTPEKPVMPEDPPHYKATVIGDKVNVRSGAGTNYYECGQLNTGDTVEVKGTQAGWSRIVPPPGSFSWIAMKYISINGDEPTVGILTGDGIWVYAGSDYEEPMHSTSKQVSLKRGAKVTLLNEEKDGYFKIVPPQGSDLWVSSQFLKREVPKPEPAVTAASGTESTVKPGVPGTEDTGVASDAEKVASPEVELLKLYGKLQEDIKTEKAKPLAEQDYTSVKKAMAEIAQNKEAGKVARFAEVWVQRIELFEFGITVAKQLEQQEEQLDQANTRIQNAKSQKLAGIQDFGRFAVTGILRPSSVYGVNAQERRYRILDAKGKTVCYVKPVGAAKAIDMTPYYGKKVGLVGKIKAHPAAAGALVEFTAFTQLD